MSHSSTLTCYCKNQNRSLFCDFTGRVDAKKEDHELT